MNSRVFQRPVKSGYVLHRTYNIIQPPKEKQASFIRKESNLLRIQSQPIDPDDTPDPSIDIYYHGDPARLDDPNFLNIITEPDVLKKDGTEILSNGKRFYLDKNKLEGLQYVHVEAVINDPEDKGAPENIRKKRNDEGRLVGGVVAIRRDTPLYATLNLWSEENTEKEFGPFFSKMFYAADVSFSNMSDQSLLLYGGSLQAEVRFLTSRDAIKKNYGQELLEFPDIAYLITTDKGVLVKDLDFTERRRPLSFNDILAIFEHEKRHTWEEETVGWLKRIGALSAAAAVFVAQPVDYLKGVAFFTGVFNTEAEKYLLADIIDHVKNLQDRSLGDIEEIAPKGQLRKVVYFPKGPIFALRANLPFYIAEISCKPSRVTAISITKESRASLE